ncbi:MAG TPA: caspase family protein [Bradyrhizobium sp.]|nr:caspase family protein [Bradyrhizobium sp.]
MTKAFWIFPLCLMLLSGLPTLRTAAAQQPEKRIALVVGDGAYAKSPLATAANDAGLIAQTLQAAGFDVVGARDLDADTLRRSFRDFIQKAQASGPGTVAMVYLAGYGMQVAGENYFIPVDSALSRDVDIPIEGLRISDYTRQLASLPLKASIVVLDAARQQPFIEGGQPIASGLALVEPDPRMLIGFNAAPGTVAPNEQGNYGIYAQSLAEMIRTGGLPLPEVFSRVRLRVNDASKGAQVPWNAEKIDAAFMFFDRSPDAPAQAPPDQAAAMRNRPIRDLGVQDAYAAALERDTLPGYEDFLAAYPGDPLARRVRAILAARREAITWLRTYRADTPPAYWSYLRRYPRGPHAGDARRRLAILTAALEPPPSFAVYDYDVLPPPPDEIIYMDRPVLVFSDPDFGFVPPPPPPVFFLPPPPPDFIILAPPIVPIGLFILPQPFFVPIPVYVRPPIYVAPPPNNIIFNNIHNTTVINNVINQPPQPRPVAPGTGAPQAGAAKGAPGPGGATPTAATAALPPSVAQRATLIQQGKLPVPPSAAINPAVKTGTPGTPGAPNAAPNKPLPANVSPQALPKANTLPVPGTKGAPAVPSGAAGPVPGAPNPNEKLAPGSRSPTASTPNVPAAAGGPKTSGTEVSPRGPKAGGSASQAKPLVPESKPKAALTPPPPPPKPAVASPKPLAAPAPQIRPPEPAARAAPPPPRPAPQIARPAPPPPVRAAPPPPPRPAPQIARPAPPPPPRAAPPPPRPAAPAAAAKKCPPNNPKC